MLLKVAKFACLLAFCITTVCTREFVALAQGEPPANPKVELESDSKLTGTITRIRQDESKGGSRVVFGTFYYLLKNQGQSVSGIGLSGGLRYAISPRFSGTGGIRQGYASQASLTTLYTAIDAGVIYAFGGSSGGAERDVLLDDRPVVRYTSSYTGGWRASLGLTQYFLSTSFSAVPFSGFSFAAFYEFSSKSAVNLDAGVQTERISNGKQSIYPTSFFVRTLIGN